MTSFFKLSGAGNDFLALVEPPELPTAGQIRSWCRRRVSLGADGLFILRPEKPDLGTPKVRIEHFNADGEEAALCINATRCAARLAFFLGWAQERVEVLTAQGRLQGREVDSTTVELEAPLPEPPPSREAVTVEGEAHGGWRVTVGVPHFVLVQDGPLSQAPVVALGRQLRRHPAFGESGTNVNFVLFPRPHQMEIRTFERGVEAETLACGTGILAAAAVALRCRLSPLPLRVQTRGGFVFELDGEAQDGVFRSWSLSGDARVVARGEILPQADERTVPDCETSQVS